MPQIKKKAKRTNQLKKTKQSPAKSVRLPSKPVRPILGLEANISKQKSHRYHPRKTNLDLDTRISEAASLSREKAPANVHANHQVSKYATIKR